MNIVRQHGMTMDRAKEWVDKQLPGLLNQFGSSVTGAQHHWESDVMHFSFEAKFAGQVRGTLRVTETDYVMDVPLGFRLRLVEGKAKAAIERWLDESLV